MLFLIWLVWMHKLLEVDTRLLTVFTWKSSKWVGIDFSRVGEFFRRYLPR